MVLKKLFSVRFVLMVFNTAIVCILFIVLYVRRDATVLTHTFSAIPSRYINFQEIDEFLKNFKQSSNARIRLKNLEVIGYEQRYSFEITYYHKDDENLSEEVKKEFTYYFRDRLLSKENYKNQKFSKVKIDLKNRKITFVDWNGVALKIPSSILLTSYSFSSDGLKIANAMKFEECELIELGENVSVSIAGKKDAHNFEMDVSLLSIGFGEKFQFFEILDIR